MRGIWKETFLFFWLIITCVAYDDIITPLSAKTQEWLHIDDGVIWIYTSFWEHRVREGVEFGVETLGPAPYVRVLMIGPFNEDFPNILKLTSCEYYYEELHSDTISTKVLNVYVPRNDDIYPENLSRPYIVYCEAPRDLTKTAPKALALNLPDFKKKSWSHDMSGSLRKWLIPIQGDPHYMHKPYTSERKLMACIKPIHGGPFLDIPMLINFLVVHHSLGVQHFVLYDAGDGSPKLYNILNLARKAGVSIEMRTWNLREHHGWMLTQTIHGEACMHDAMNLGFENVITIDYDESLVPHATVDGNTSPSYLDMLNSLDKQHPNAAYYRFPNVFYMLNQGSSSSSGSNSGSSTQQHVSADELLVSLRFSRHLTPTPDGARTKCIYKPHRMSQIYTHFGTPLNSSYAEVALPPEYAQIHHYRRHTPAGGYHQSEVSEDYTVRDRYAALLRGSALYKTLAEVMHPLLP